MKMFFIVVALTFIYAARVVAAEPIRVQPVEGEISIGLSTPFKKYRGMENCPGLDSGYELRCNMTQVPVAIGLMATVYSPVRTPLDGHKGLDYHGGLLLGATGEYNFFRGKTVNPFAGIGTGVGFLDSDNFDNGRSHVRPFLRPKIGVELFHHLRLNLSITVTTPAAMGWSFSIAGVIGGRPRKNK